MIRPRFAGALAATILLAACGATSTTMPAQTVASPTAHIADHGPSHIAVIVMENEEYRRHHRLAVGPVHHLARA